MYRTFLPSEPKKSKKSKEKLSDATLRSGRNTGYIAIDVDATVDVLAKALTLFVYRSIEPITFRGSGGTEGDGVYSGLEIEEKMKGKVYHELRDRNNNSKDVWKGIARIHKILLRIFDRNRHHSGDTIENSVTNILESIRGVNSDLLLTPIIPNKRIKAKLRGGGHYGWSPCEAALFVLCVKDAATMDNKLDFWSINEEELAKGFKI